MTKTEQEDILGNFLEDDTLTEGIISGEVNMNIVICLLMKRMMELEEVLGGSSC